MVQVSTLEQVVMRFDTVFQNASSNDFKRGARSKQVAAVIEHLKRHTQRRRGEAVLEEGLIEWEQTSRIYELFCVDLNMFERIFFTVDVGETTSVLSQLCSFFLIFMILVSIVMWMVSTLPAVNDIPSDCKTCAPEPAEIFKVIERISVYVFTVEYLIRILTVHSVRFALLYESFLQAVLTGTAKSDSSGKMARSASALDTSKSDNTL